MGKTMHRLSGILFYLLGLSYFAAYLLSVNAIGGLWPKWWMSVADLPMALVTCTYGGTSLYGSITSPGHRSWAAIILITLPLTAFFLALVALNYWDALQLSRFVAR